MKNTSGLKAKIKQGNKFGFPTYYAEITKTTLYGTFKLSSRKIERLSKADAALDAKTLLQNHLY